MKLPSLSLHALAVTTMFSGVLSLAAMALGKPFLLVFIATCVSSVCGFLMAMGLQAQRRTMELSGIALGGFNKGNLDARILHFGQGEFEKLQHRINNLLDTLDIWLRGHESALDQAQHQEYIARLQVSGLYDALQEASGRTEDPAAEAPSGVGNFLRELRDNLLNGTREGEESPKPTAEPHQLAEFRRRQQVAQRHLQHTMSRLDAALAQLQARMQPLDGIAAPAEMPVGLLQRLAENANLLVLNLSIEAGKFGGEGGALHGVAEDMREMVRQLEQAARQLPMQATSPMPYAASLAYAAEALQAVKKALGYQYGLQQAALDLAVEPPEAPSEAA